MIYFRITGLLLPVAALSLLLLFYPFCDRLFHTLRVQHFFPFLPRGLEEM